MSFFKSDVHESLLAPHFVYFVVTFFLSVHPRLVYFESNCIRTHYVRSTFSLKKVKCAQTSALLSSSSSSPKHTKCKHMRHFWKKKLSSSISSSSSSIYCAIQFSHNVYFEVVFVFFSALYRLSSSFIVRKTLWRISTQSSPRPSATRIRACFYFGCGGTKIRQKTTTKMKRNVRHSQKAQRRRRDDEKMSWVELWTRLHLQ